MKRANPEDQLHRAVARYLALVLKPPTIWTTIGLGGGGRVRGAQLKAKGVKAGWPDIIVMRPVDAVLTKLVRVIGIELKASNGRLSPAQLAVRDGFERAGGFWHTCRSLDETIEALKSRGIL